MVKQKLSKKDIIRPVKDKLIKLVTDFCDKHLDDDYEHLCIDVIEKMSRKRNVPFLTGRLEIWAASIIHALGRINFLYDKSFTPYITMDELAAYFNTSKRTIGPKSSQIEIMFSMAPFHPEFSTLRMLKKSPYRNMAMTEDGYIIYVPDELLPLLE